MKIQKSNTISTESIKMIKLYILFSALSALPLIGRERGLEIVRQSEGLHLTAYRCPAGKLTIGYGHTANVYEGQTITKSKAEMLLKEDYRRAEQIVDRVVKMPLNAAQRAALTSFTFNVGERNLRALVCQNGRLNDGNYESVEQWLPKYIYSNGNKLKGLEIRRNKELKLWKQK